MHTRYGVIAAASAAALLLAGCSSSSETPSASSTPTGGETMTAQECLPVPGDALTVLADDQMLQNSDNIIPAVNSAIADDALLDALNAVSGALDTETLISLNKAVDIDRQTSAEVAAEWFLDSGISVTEGSGGSVVIGAANFSENITLAEIYSEALDAAGFSTEVRTIGNRETYLPALESGEVHVVPEYAATFAEFLNKAANGTEAAPVASGDIGETTAALAPLAEAVGIIVGEAAAAQDQNAFAVTQAFADQYGVSTLSELAEACGPIVLGGPPECPERVFCQPGLEETYGIEVGEFRALDAGGPLTKTAITTGEIAVGLVFSSDGALG